MQTEHSETIISNTASLVLKNSSILVFYLSQEGKFIYANEKFIQEIGFSLPELLERSIFELSPHLTNSVWMMMISSSVDINYTLTFALRTMNGKTMPMEATIQSLKTSTERYICCLARDISNQKKLEEFISVQNSILDSISRLNKIGTWEYDIQQSKLTWSHEMYTIHNVSTSYNPSFEKMLQFFEKDSRANVLFLFEQLMNASIKNISIEVPILTEYGNKVWIMLNASAEKTSSNTIFKIYGTYQDVTDKINDNLRFSSLYDRYIRATKAAKTGIFEQNLTTREMYWDPTMYTLFEVEENEFSKSNSEWLKQTYPEDIQKVQNAIRIAVDTKTQVYEEFRIFTKNTGLRWLRIIGEARYDSEGNPTHFIGVNIDISEQKKKDKDLIRSNQFFHSVFSSVDQAIFVIEKNIDGKIIYIDSNPAHQKLSGIQRDELIGKSPEEIPVLVKDKISKILLEKYAECFNSNSIIEYEESITENGQKNWWFTRLTPISNESGEVYRVIASSLDTTKLKQTEEELLKKNQMFQSIAALQQEFISTRFSLFSLHAILLDCMNNTGSTFGMVAEVTDDKIECLVPISSICVLSALIKKSNGAVKQAVPALHQMNLESVELFKPASLQSIVIQNNSSLTLHNSGFPPAFPPITTFVLKPLKIENKLIGFLMLANSNEEYTTGAIESINPLLTTMETIFAGFKIMYKEGFITKIVSELLTSTSQSIGTSLFDTLTKSLSNVLNVECACILQYENEKLQLVSAFHSGKNETFVVSNNLKSFFENLIISEELSNQQDIPVDLFEDEFIVNISAKKYLFKKVYNNENDVIGLLCLLYKSKLPFAEIVHSTLSVLAIRVSAEMERISTEIEKNKLSIYAQSTIALERRNILLSLFQDHLYTEEECISKILQTAYKQLSLSKATYLQFERESKCLKVSQTYPSNLTSQKIEKFVENIENVFSTSMMVFDTSHSETNEEILLSEFLQKPYLEQSTIIIPLKHNDMINGCLLYEKNHLQKFPKEDLDFVLSLSSLLPYTWELIEKRMTEKALQENKELYFSAFYNHPDPSIVITSQAPFIVQNINLAAKEWNFVFKENYVDFIGSPLEEILQKELYLIVQRSIEHLQQSSKNNFLENLPPKESATISVATVKMESNDKKLFQVTFRQNS